jgi:hypothetical protein
MGNSRSSLEEDLVPAEVVGNTKERAIEPDIWQLVITRGDKVLTFQDQVVWFQWTEPPAENDKLKHSIGKRLRGLAASIGPENSDLNLQVAMPMGSTSKFELMLEDGKLIRTEIWNIDVAHVTEDAVVLGGIKFLTKLATQPQLLNSSHIRFNPVVRQLKNTGTWIAAPSWIGSNGRPSAGTPTTVFPIGGLAKFTPIRSTQTDNKKRSSLSKLLGVSASSAAGLAAVAGTAGLVAVGKLGYEHGGQHALEKVKRTEEYSSYQIATKFNKIRRQFQTIREDHLNFGNKDIKEELNEVVRSMEDVLEDLDLVLGVSQNEDIF